MRSSFLPLFLLALPFMGRSARMQRVVFVLATIAGALTAFGIVAPFLPGFTQGSFAVIALAAPAGLMTSWIIRERARPVPVPTT